MKNQYTYQDRQKERKTLNMKNWDWVHFVSYAMLDMSCYCVFLNRRAFVLVFWGKREVRPIIFATRL